MRHTDREYEQELLELQIMRLLSCRRELLEVAAQSETRPGEVQEFLDNTLLRCADLARKYALGVESALFLGSS